MLNKNTFLGVKITNEKAEDILEYLLQRLKNEGKFYIVTPNPEILVYATRHENFKKILNSSEISLPDGIGLFLASVLLGKPFKQRIPGVDFIDFICKNTVRKPISMGFLGGRAGVAEKTAECLLTKYPHLEVVFAGSDWNEEGFRVAEMIRRKTLINTPKHADGENQRLDLRSSAQKDTKSASTSRSEQQKIDLLFVAYGAPRQEEWIYKNLDKIPVKAAMGVGGAFDYISGNVKRAPFLVRAIGFEWLYRLVKEPWRWRRQLALVEFVKLIIKERFKRSI